MKKSLVARGFVGAVASLLGVAMVGCGADVGDGAAGDSAEIGSVAEAITRTATSFDNIASNREFAASCKVSDGTKNYMLVFAGENSGGTVLNDFLLFDPSAAAGSQWSLPNITGTMPLVNTLTGENRSHHKMLPLSATECLIAGGKNGSTDKLNAKKVTVNFGASPVTVTVASAGTLSGRSDFHLLPCGSGKAIAIGGATGGLSTPQSTQSIEIWDGSTTWDPAKLSGTIQELSFPRFDFAAIKDPTASTNRYVIAGGNIGGSLTDDIETIDATSTCDKTTVTVNDISTAANKKLNQTNVGGVRGGVLMNKSSNNFLYAAGYTVDTNGSSVAGLYTSADTITTPFGTPSVSVAASVIATATNHPTLVDTGTEYVLIGGDNGAGTLGAIVNSSSSPLTAVQKYVPGGAFTNATTALGTGRVAAVAEFLRNVTSPSVKRFTYVSAGYNPNTPADVSTTEEIETP